MAFLGFRAYPTPVLKPMLPFLIGGAIVFYGVNAGQKAMMQSKDHVYLVRDGSES